MFKEVIVTMVTLFLSTPALAKGAPDVGHVHHSKAHHLVHKTSAVANGSHGDASPRHTGKRAALKMSKAIAHVKRAVHD